MGSELLSIYDDCARPGYAASKAITDEILSTPGVDAAYIGPADLAFGLGLPPYGDNPDPTHAAAIERILEACKRNGVAAGGDNGLGLKADGSIVAWGENDDGQTDAPYPNSGFIAVAAGSGHLSGRFFYLP